MRKGGSEKTAVVKGAMRRPPLSVTLPSWPDAIPPYKFNKLLGSINAQPSDKRKRVSGILCLFVAAGTSTAAFIG
ncbi:hypothetical protein ACNKHR_13260 [Shigella flexneri]